jgi:hypothetical protein
MPRYRGPTLRIASLHLIRQLGIFMCELSENVVFPPPPPPPPRACFAQANKCYDFVSVILKQVVNKLMLDSNRQKLMADLLVLVALSGLSVVL